MKILKRGKKKADLVYTSTCKGCDSVLEFTTDDGIYFTDRNERVLKVKCPVCDQWIYKSLD